jgi:hypothetical protein
MDFFSFNYKPKDFKGKSTKDILAMKPSKVGDDFFTKYAAEIKEGDQALTEDELNAVQLLSDLKDKTKILEKCYTKHTKHSIVPGHHSIKKHPHAAAPAAAAAAPVPEAAPAGDVTEDVRELIPEQTGGRRSRKHKRSTKKRSTKKRSTKKRSTQSGGRKKRSTKKRSTKKRSTKKRSTQSGGRKRVYSGGLNLQQLISPLPTTKAADMAIPLDSKLDIKLNLTPNAKSK